MVISIKELEGELEKELAETELQIVRLEAQRDEIQKTLARLNEPVGTKPVIIPNFKLPHGKGTAFARPSITALGKHHYEFGNRQFERPGYLLDHLDAPHYFSHRYPNQGDQAAREILRWAKRNPEVAATILVVLADGTKLDLYAAVNAISP